MNTEKMFKFSFGCNQEELPQTVVVSPYIPLKNFAKTCNIEKQFNGYLYSGGICSRENKTFGYICCGVGDRLMGDAILLLKETSVRNIIFIGSCGAFGECKIGDYIVAPEAVNGEGFSRYYDDEKIETILSEQAPYLSSGELTENIKQYIANNKNDKREVNTGRVFTIGSILAEDDNALSALDENGIIGIEMELSAVYKSAEVSGKKAASVLIVSDLPLSKPIWGDIPKEDRTWYNEGKQEAIEMVINFIATSKSL